MRRAESALFAPFVSLGVVCNEVRPAYSVFHGKNAFTSVICAVDNVVLRYRADMVKLVSISDPLPEKVTHVMASAAQCTVYAVSGKRIAEMFFGRAVTRWIELEAVPKHCILFGDTFVIVDMDNGIRVVDVEDGTQLLHLEGSPHFDVTSIVHPPTYLNKILVGSSEGVLRLYNIRTGKLVHEFAKQFDAPIVLLEATPAVDVIGIGLKNGRVVLHNVKMDDTVCSFKHDHQVTAIGFRTDESLMTSADTEGLIAVWDLEKRELVGRIGGVHKDAVNSLYFLPGQPVMISTSLDNSMYSWILDQADGMPRQHIVNEGHAEPVQTITFSDSTRVISAGLDGTVRRYVVNQPSARNKLGTAVTVKVKKSKLKKTGQDVNKYNLEPVCEIAIGWSRESSWDNVLCRHTNQLLVTTWTTRKECQGTHKLVHERFTKHSSMFHAIASSIAISPCGNYAFIGYSTGHIDQFNIQSGRYLRTFIDGSKPKKEIDPKTKEEKLSDGYAHTASVNGLSIDSLGHELVSGDAGGTMKFWDLRTGELRTRMRAKSGITRMQSCKSNSLLAVSLMGTDGKAAIVSIVDVITRKIVRTFRNVGNEVLAMEFSHDGRWLLTADEKSFIRVWELSTSSLIDVMLYGSPCIGMSFGRTGEYLATCHKDEKAVYVWANKCLFTSRVVIKSLPLDYIPTWDETGVTIMDFDELPDINDLLTEEDDESQLDPSLVTYSGLAPSRWANLPDLALIKDRNKPIEPPKKPKSAPFFLSSALTLDGFEFEKVDHAALEAEQRKTIQAKRSLLDLESNFTSKLRRASSSEELLECFDFLRQMSVSATDFQIRSLLIDVLPQFFKMLLEVLRSRKTFDLVQAYLAAALKIHRSNLWSCVDDEESELTTVLEQIGEEQEKVWNEYDNLLTHNASVVQWTKNALI